ncbi:C40 family peptidase [Pseudactinotalea terrae]|uniref:C40 family peptidase n=1 Tax=Pseudactinotalea terrae TaxID=1743262 RepID=UPI0012E2329E|nr:C40 family peptidase [Pseudactinotalea terrae]
MSVAAITARIGQIEAGIASLQSRSLQHVAAPTTTSTSGSGAVVTAGTDTATTFASALTAASTPASASSLASAVSPAPSPASPGTVSGGSTTGDDVVTAAKRYLGVPYVWGGESLSEGGFDCSGLVQQVFGELGTDLPRTARQQMTAGEPVASLAEARPGDLIVTRGGGHIMIYIGNGQVLHAPRPGEDVQIRDLFETDADITAIRRIVPAGGNADLVAAAARTAVTGASS